jgi:inorganic pyrophosphatase
VLYAKITDIHQLNPAVLDQIEAFFVNYQKLCNVQFIVRGRRGPERAYELQREAGYEKHAA